MDRSYLVLQKHLDALCPELAAVVADAIANGNEVVETWTGFGQAIRLLGAEPILIGITDGVRGLLTYASVKDPHYWLGEIHCRLHPGWFIALSYAAGAREPEGLPDSSAVQNTSADNSP